MNGSHSSQEVTNLVGPGFLFPCIFIIGMNRILLKGCLTYVLTTRCIAMLEDFMPYTWICFVPPYFYLRNPNLRVYVWNLMTRKISVNDQNELVELQVMWNTQFDSNIKCLPTLFCIENLNPRHFFFLSYGDGLVFCYQNCSDLLREKLLKFKAENREFANH